jgi:hypothetical protein
MLLKLSVPTILFCKVQVVTQTTSWGYCCYEGEIKSVKHLDATFDIARTDNVKTAIIESTALCSKDTHR